MQKDLEKERIKMLENAEKATDGEERITLRKHAFQQRAKRYESDINISRGKPTEKKIVALQVIGPDTDSSQVCTLRNVLQIFLRIRFLALHLFPLR